MVIESDLQKIDQNDSKIELYVNTSAFTDEDFKTYLNICEKIQYNEQMRHDRSPSRMITATMTREEIFECSTLDEDGFLNALEYQNSYVAPPLQELNLSQSMAEALQYFDQDVVVDSGSSTAHTPVKQESRVTAVLATLKGTKGNSAQSPILRRHQWIPAMATSSKIQELRKQYETVQTTASRSPKKSKSPRALRKSMVKQLAKIFNSKVTETATKTVSKPEQQRNIKTRAVRVSYRPQLLPSPVHSPRSKRKQSNKTHCLVAEHVFKQLSVKDKASLFNKYGNEDSSKNGEQLDKTPEAIQTKSRRRFVRGEVINEKQKPVKQLKQKLEAKSIVLQQNSATSRNVKNNSANKESKCVTSSFKNNVESQLTVKEAQDSKEQRGRNQNAGEAQAVESFIERSVGKKAISTQINIFPKSEELSGTNRNAEEVQADEVIIEKRLSIGEKAISTEINVFPKSSDIEQNLSIVMETIPITREPNLEAATAKPLKFSSADEAIQHAAKSTSFTKLGSNEPHNAESFGATFSKALKCKLAKTAKPKRKKKMRRILLWKPELSMVEAKTVQSTDSESEFNTSEITTPVKFRNLSNHIKKTIGKVSIQHYEPFFDAFDDTIRRNMGSPLTLGVSHSLSIVFSEQHISGLYGSIISQTSQRDLSRSCPSLMIEASVKVELLEVKAEVSSTSIEIPQPSKQPPIQLATQPSTLQAIQPSTPSPAKLSTQTATQPSMLPVKPAQSNVSRKLIDSYVDQGFETGSNELNTTLHMSTVKETQKLNKSEASLLSMLAHEMAESSETNGKYPSGFSTPVKGHLQEGTGDDALEKIDLSPILVTPTKSSGGTPLKSSTVSMQPVNMDLSRDCRENSVSLISRVKQGASPSKLSTVEVSSNDVARENSVSLINRVKQGASPSKLSTVDVSSNAVATEKASSVFWINTGDFCVSLDIYHNTTERLSLLYDIFSQKSYESRDISFGIDEQMYFAKESIELGNIRAHFPSINNCSHYWFVSGDMTLPFMGKFMLPQKIQRLFNIVREAVAESGTLRFGVDHYDFSSVPVVMYGKTFISPNRPMTHTPDAMTSSINSNSIRTSDLDRSEFDSEASVELSLSSTPLSNNQTGSISMDSAHFTLPRHGLMSSENPSLEYEQETSMNQIFEDAMDQGGENATNTKWMSKPLHMLQTQQQKLKAVEQRIHCYSNSLDLNAINSELELFKDSSDYVSELQEIIGAIIDIGQVTGFKNCSLHQLESFTYFLSHYADICLDSCLEHMDRILEALKEKRGLKT